MTHVVTVIGDRQTGKTEMAVSLAHWLIQLNQSVLYVAEVLDEAINSMNRMECAVGQASRSPSTGATATKPSPTTAAAMSDSRPGDPSVHANSKVTQ